MVYNRTVIAAGHSKANNCQRSEIAQAKNSQEFYDIDKNGSCRLDGFIGLSFGDDGNIYQITIDV